MSVDANPFAVMSLIVAPAILTNACSVLVMSTSNRLARGVDRARELSKQLESAHAAESDEAPRRFDELVSTEGRTLLLVRSLRSLYVGLGGFALAALVSLLGAILVPFASEWTVRCLEIAAVVAGFVAVGALLHASSLLIAETRIAVQVVHDRVDRLRAKHRRAAADDDRPQ